MDEKLKVCHEQWKLLRVAIKAFESAGQTVQHAIGWRDER